MNRRLVFWMGAEFHNVTFQGPFQTVFFGGGENEVEENNCLQCYGVQL